MSRRRRRSGVKRVLQRATALFLAGVGVWMLWMTADLTAVGQALETLGSNTRFTAALLTAELGRL